MEKTGVKRSAAFKLGFSLSLIAICSGTWIWFAKTRYNFHIPASDFWFICIYPLPLGIIAILATLIFDRSLKPLALKSASAGYFALALLLSIMFTFVPFSLNLFLSLTDIKIVKSLYVEILMVGTPIWFGFAIMEELMWRGTLLPAMLQLYSFRASSVIIGLVWALWHFPFILFTQMLYSQQPIVFTLPMFTLLIIALSFVYNYLRKASGSIWPGVLLHAVTNIVSYFVIQQLEKSAYKWSPFFINDIGLLYAFAAIAAAMYFAGIENNAKEI